MAISHSTSRTPRRRLMEGLALTTLSAAAFGTLPILVKFAYGAGVEPTAMLCLRFMLAGSMMLAIMRLKKLSWPKGKNLLVLIGMGALGYAGQSFCFFSALKYASAGLVSLLLYLYPALVTFFGALLFKQKLNRVQVVAVLAALGGTSLIIGDDAAGTLPGILFGIGAALIYATYILVGSRVLKHEGALQSSTIIMLGAGCMFGLAAAVQRPAFPETATGLAVIVAIALFATVLPIVTFFAGMTRLGAAEAATVSTLEPVVTLLLAAMLLDEPLRLSQLCGGAVILGALIILARVRPDRPDSSGDGSSLPQP